MGVWIIFLLILGCVGGLNTNSTSPGRSNITHPKTSYRNTGVYKIPLTTIQHLSTTDPAYDYTSTEKSTSADPVNPNFVTSESVMNVTTRPDLPLTTGPVSPQYEVTKQPTTSRPSSPFPVPTTSSAQPMSSTTTSLPIVDPNTCVNTVSLGPPGNIPSHVVQLPAVVSVATVSILGRDSSLILWFVDETAKKLLCVTLQHGSVRTVVSFYCGNQKSIRNETWPTLPSLANTVWPTELKSNYLSHPYLHIDIRTQIISRLNPRSTLILSPNGESERKIDIDVYGIPYLVYIFLGNVEVGVNLVSFHNHCTATRCLYHNEKVGWNQTAYFLPDVKVDEVIIDISFCMFYEKIRYQVNSTEYLSQWYSLSFSPNYPSKKNYFSRQVFVDGEEVRNLTISNDQPDGKMRRIKWCPLETASIQIIGASWTLDCDPTNAATVSRLTKDKCITIFLLIFSLALLTTS